MPITPGQKVKIKDTFPHQSDGGQYETVGASDRAMRGRTGTVTKSDRKYDNVVVLDSAPDDDHWGYFYDHELEMI